MKRVLIDQGGDAEVMYPDLFRGLKLRPEDLNFYDSPLIRFDGKVVFPNGQIRLPVQVGSEVVEVNFIVVDGYSLYIAIVSSTLHLKVKYSSGDQVEELVYG